MVCISPRCVSDQAVQGLYEAKVCIEPRFKSVKGLYRSKVYIRRRFVSVRGLISQRFVLDQLLNQSKDYLYQSKVCMVQGLYGSRFVWSKVCMVQGLYGSRFVWSKVFISRTFSTRIFHTYYMFIFHMLL